MKKQVWKFQLKSQQDNVIVMPIGAEVLSVQVQNGDPFIWALVNPNNEKQNRYFEIYGTGHDIHCDMGIERKFIDTFQIYHGALVFHLFERLF